MKILVIAPHPDDEVLGVGGTIAKYAAEGNDVYVCIVTKGCEPLFAEDIVEKTRGECRKADNFLGVKETIFLDFPAVMIEEALRYEFNGALERVIRQVEPEEVYLPHRGDMQLDHKLVVDAAMVALRPKCGQPVKRIYAYETLSETGWDVSNTVNAFIPTAYQDITGYLDKKLEALSMFQSQLAEFPEARSLQAVKALAIYRGAMMGICAAEAFVVIREIYGHV